MPGVQMPGKDSKLEALREQGTLNPRPREVTDPLFAKDTFFDPRDLVQVKYEMLRRVQSEDHSVTGAATAFGFSRPSFYQALSAYEEGGLAGLVPHKRGPKQAHKLTEEVLAFIVETRQKDPSVRTADLARLIQERFGTKVHPRSIERSLRSVAPVSGLRGNVGVQLSAIAGFRVLWFFHHGAGLLRIARRRQH